MSWYVSRDLGFLPKDYPKPLYQVTALMSNTLMETADCLDLSDAKTIPSKLPEPRQRFLTQFADVFTTDGSLRTMTGPSMTIELCDDAIPYAVNGARPIPFACCETLKEMLDDMVKQGVIEPVSRPTNWLHPLVVVPKSYGKIRLSVELTRLNRHVKRPFHPLTTPKDAVCNISSRARVYSTFDAIHGYWHVPLDDASQELTTFLTPLGRFKFIRGTMRLISVGDEFCHRVDAAMRSIGLPQKSNHTEPGQSSIISK